MSGLSVLISESLALRLCREPLFQTRAQIENARNAFRAAFRISLMHKLGYHVPDLFAALDQFRCRASLQFQSVQAFSQVIGESQHLLKRAGQLRQVFQPVAPCAELRPAECFRSSSDSVNPVTFGAVEPPCVSLSSKVFALFEELERLAMTRPAHLERSAYIWSGNELTCVCLVLV